jgi:ubiquitin C-terminal hydrolase
MELKNKSVMVAKIRLWKSDYEDNEKAIKDLDQKYYNYTHVKVNASILNITAD